MARDKLKKIKWSVSKGLTTFCHYNKLYSWENEPKVLQFDINQKCKVDTRHLMRKNMLIV